MEKLLTAGNYVIANDLIGFRSTSLRVFIEVVYSASQVRVTTADLLDAGTHLILDGTQLSVIDEPVALQHKDGLVIFG